MEMHIDPLSGDYSGQLTTLANAVYLRLKTPLGSYWAIPSLGSLLHTLKREKDVSRVNKLAVQYSEQALQPIIDDGRATKITITASRPKPGWLVLLIVVESANGQETFKHPVRVI
ncbi:TPA: phage GP46 family protein [Serratia fonticola]|nr:phage GP46 family protein [Serratia fonticola]